MMKRIILYLGLLVFIYSCTGHGLEIPDPVNGPEQDSSMVEISFSSILAEEIIPAKASAVEGIESDIYDVNIYFFSSRNPPQHYYFTSNTGIKLRLINDTYDIYVIANRQSDLGELTLDQVRNLKSSALNEGQITMNDKMVMSGCQNIAISRNTTIRVQLRRLAAKVTFNISMSAAMSADSKLVHIQPLNCNSSVYLFSDSRLAASDGSNYYVHSVGATPVTSLSKSYYFMENMQGKNGLINSQSERTKDNAPLYATYLWIRVERNRKYIDYRVYLGGNLTDDFNLRRNKNYVYNIVIEGENPADLRVSTADIVIRKGRPSIGQQINSYDQILFEPPYNLGYCELHIETTNNEPDNAYTLHYYSYPDTFNPGWSMQYMIRGIAPEEYKPLAKNQKVKVHTGNGKTVISFMLNNGIPITAYDQAVFFVITDKYGYTKSIRVATSNTLN